MLLKMLEKNKRKQD